MSDQDGLRRVRLIVRGRVQGVAFRAHTAELARQAGLAGWVRNRADGSVEAALEGPSRAVDAVLAQVRRGPRGARVDSVDACEETPRGELAFAIRG